jgi:hypothetical protein
MVDMDLDDVEAVASFVSHGSLYKKEPGGLSRDCL